MPAIPGTSISPYEAALGLRYLWGLPGFLRRPIDPGRARAALARRFERRSADFLALVGRAIYRQPCSPYHRLLALAGCELGDLEALVGREGVEGALAELVRRGVYLMVDEYKGRRPVRRGSATLSVDPSRLHNPLITPQLLASTSGSGGARTPVPIDFAWLRERAVDVGLLLEARGGRRVAHAGLTSAGTGLTTLKLASVGLRQERWFWSRPLAGGGLHPRYRWAYRMLRLGGLLGGYPVPRAEAAPPAEPWPILDWMAAVLRAGRTPNLFTFVSPAVRLCQLAAESGRDLRGARFTVTGEPLTAGRLGVIRRAGAEAVLTYGSMDAGGDVAEGCLAPDAPDEVHLLHDLYALIQPEAGGGRTGLPPDALLISTLRPTAPLVLLNVSMGDRAEVATRACGCPLEALGWATHLSRIRSFEKLTAGGMTFLDTDVIRVLEEALPARFGGGPTDYQLLEEEAADGTPRVRLLVDPTVGPLDPAAVAEAFLAAIGPGGSEQLMAINWRQADLLRVERRPPLATATGKILHLVQERRPAPAGR